MSIPNGATIKPLVKLGRSPEECWSWLGSIGDNGCALKQFHGQQIPARRWLWSQLFGPIPLGMVIYTSCGSGSCINPFHLRMGTQADAVRSGAGTILLRDDVAEIRRETCRDKRTAERYAKRYGVSIMTVRDVWRRDSWVRGRPFHGPATSKHPRRFIAAQPTGEAN